MVNLHVAEDDLKGLEGPTNKYATPIQDKDDLTDTDIDFSSDSEDSDGSAFQEPTPRKRCKKQRSKLATSLSIDDLERLLAQALERRDRRRSQSLSHDGAGYCISIGQELVGLRTDLPAISYL